MHLRIQPHQAHSSKVFPRQRPIRQWRYRSPISPHHRNVGRRTHQASPRIFFPKNAGPSHELPRRITSCDNFFLGNLLKHVHHLKITILWSHPNSCVGSHPHLTIVTLFNTHRTCYIVFYCHVEYFTCILLSSNEFTFFYLSPFYNHFPLL